jgi:hypothetical protein
VDRWFPRLSLDRADGAGLVVGHLGFHIRNTSVRAMGLAGGFSAVFRKRGDADVAPGSTIIATTKQTERSMMKVRATCDTCGRNFLLSQIGPQSDAPGRCPFCGARFARHYNSVLMDAVAGVENGTQRFIDLLAKLQAMETGFDIDMEALLSELQREVLGNERSATT